MPLERMDREVRMERLDPEDWLVRVALEVCSDPVVLQAHLDHPVLLELTDLQVLKETWAHKESQVLLVSRAYPEHRVFLVLKVRLVHLEKKDLRAGQGCPDCLELMDLLVILVKRVHLEKKEHRVLRVHRVRSAILVPVVSRVLMVSAVSRGQRERRVKMASQVSRGIWESKETGVSLACSAHVERTAQRVRKAELVPLENLDLLVRPEKRVN